MEGPTQGKNGTLGLQASMSSPNNQVLDSGRWGLAATDRWRPYSLPTHNSISTQCRLMEGPSWYRWRPFPLICYLFLYTDFSLAPFNLCILPWGQGAPLLVPLGGRNSRVLIPVLSSTFFLLLGLQARGHSRPLLIEGDLELCPSLRSLPLPAQPSETKPLLSGFGCADLDEVSII